MNARFLDRNLLLGTLALQMDFIDRDQLVNAMNAWVLDKSQPLEGVLLNQHAIEEDTCQLLIALINKHLEMESSDPRRVLAAMSSGELRQTLSSVTDADVIATLTHVTEAAESTHPDATRSLDMPPLAESGERFEVLRLHASGGLGEVWVARDTELNREVALKEIKSRHANNANSRARFVTEAEVTGRLEHPCVVPVYAMGQHADGRPYYAMRFIKGESLGVAIGRLHQDQSRRAFEVDLRKLLDRFLDVCNAVDYAHSRGVVHRDIKPSNIMLGRYGETSVVDWGLAKYVGRDEAHRDPTETALVPGDSGDYAKTAMGSAVGTIQYMSPEQAAGSSDIVGPQSDIYSLGATLYSLLCGQPPIAPSGSTEDLDTLRRRLNLGDYPPPRQVNSRVPTPLEAICLKAMAVRPEARYATARDLSADIEAWLADEPVTAWREPLRVKAGRWMRHHRALATGIAVAASVALVSLLIGVVFLSASRERERQSRQTAVQNFQLARDAVDQYLTKVSEDDRLRGKALEPLKRELLETARHFYDEFVRRAADDPHLRTDLEYERGRAYWRLAYLTGELGSKEKAIELARTSLQIFTALHESDPSNLDYEYELADRHNELGALYHQVDQVAEAERHYLEATKQFRALSTDHSDRLEYANSLGRTENNLGLLYEATLRMNEARVAQESARDIFRRLSNKVPKKVEYRYHLASSLHNLARLHQLDGRVVSAEATFQESSDLLSALVETEKPLPDWTYLFGMNQNHLGWLYETSQRFEEASTVLQDGLERMKDLVMIYPDVPKYQRVLAAIHNQYGRIHLSLGDKDAADTSFHTAFDLCQPLVDSDPSFAGHQDLMARIHYNLGWLSLERDDPAGAIVEYQQAAAIEQRIAEKHSEMAEYQSILGWIHGDLATAYTQVGRMDSAASHYEAAHDVWKRLSASSSSHYLASEATSLENWSDFLWKQKQRDLAEEKLKEAIQIRQRLFEENQSADLTRRFLAASMFRLALIQGGTDRLDDAVATYRRILQLVPEYPEAHCNLGHKLQELGQFSAAVESFRKGHEIGSKYPAWTYPSENWLEQSKRYAAIERVLADVVAGQAEADDSDQWILMAEACDVSRRPAAAARMYQKAFEADEDLASDIRRGLRYVAAECAARASMGRDNDLPQLNENERIQLHKQAIEWLRADLEVRKQQLQSGSPEVRKDVQGKLEHWKKDEDLAGIRETDLTPSQLELQKEFWKDVDALLRESPE